MNFCQHAYFFQRPAAGDPLTHPDPVDGLFENIRLITDSMLISLTLTFSTLVKATLSWLGWAGCLTHDMQANPCVLFIPCFCMCACKSWGVHVIGFNFSYKKQEYNLLCRLHHYYLGKLYNKNVYINIAIQSWSHIRLNLKQRWKTTKTTTSL